MAKYVVSINWTDQGVRSAKDTVTRFEQNREAMRQMGVTIETVFWTLGRYDLVGILDAPDDQTVATGLLRLAGLGNVRTEALRAFTAEEMGGMVQRLG